MLKSPVIRKSLGVVEAVERKSWNSDRKVEQELTAEAGSKPFDEARNTVMVTAPYRK